MTAPTSTNGQITAIKNTDYVFQLSDFNFSDTDGDTLASITINTIPYSEIGALKLNGNAVLNAVTVSLDDISAGSLVFTAESGFVGDNIVSFEYYVTDSADEQSDTTNTIEINVHAFGTAKVLDDAFIVNTETTGDQKYADVVMLSDGGYVIIWYSGMIGNEGIFGQVYDSEHNTVGAEFSANTTSYSSTYFHKPSITALEDGGFVVTWTSSTTGAHDIYAQMFNSAGSMVGDEILVNTITDGNQVMPEVTILSNGGFAIAWRGENVDGDSYGIAAQAFDASGVKVGEEQSVNVTTAGGQAEAEITSLSSGGFVVMWMTYSGGDNYKGYARIYDNAGQVVSDEIILGTNFYNGSLDVLGMADGKFLTVWYESGLGNIGQLYDSTGTVIGEPILLGTGLEDQSVFSIGDGFLFTWTDDSSPAAIWAQQYDALGEEIGAAFIIHQSDNEQSLNIGDLSVVDTGNGTFLATWHSANEGLDGDGYSIVAQEFTLPVVIDGVEFTVLTEGSGDQGLEMAALAGGGSVVVWTGGAEIQAKIYDGASNVLANAFDVSTFTSGQVWNPSVASLSDGGFVVAWTALNDVDGDGYGIFAQRFDADGQEVGTTFGVNSTIAGNQDMAKVSGLSDGGYVVVWSTADGDGGYALASQIYDLTGVAVGGEFTVSDTKVGYANNHSVTSLEGGGFAVGWSAHLYDTNGSAVVKQFDSSGTAMTGEIEISRYGARVDITGLPDGGYVVVYRDYDSAIYDYTGDGGDAIVGQIFNASGQADGSKFVINTKNGATQSSPSVAAFDDGSFIVTWHSYDSDVDGDEAGISAQIFNSDGNFLGEEFTLNDEIESYQRFPTVIVGVDGNVFVAWDSDDTDHGTPFGGIAGMVFDPQLDSLSIRTTSTDTDTDTDTDNVSVDGAGVSTTTNSDGSEDQTGTSGADKMTGGSKGDELDGGKGADTLKGGKGADKLDGGSGKDKLYGGSGGDKLYGGSGGDTLDGGSGKDKLYGGSGADKLYGGSGNDTLKGGKGADILKGGKGDDLLKGGASKDALSGGSGKDVLYGNSAADKLYGGKSHDKLYGGTGNDKLSGASGKDKLYGGSGKDTLTGGTGNDKLTGGKGSDKFVFSGTWGDDKIKDFADGKDMIDLSGTDFSFADLTITKDGSDVVVEDGNGNSITIEDVNIASITEDDFIFG